MAALVFKFVSMPIAIRAHLWSITTMALVTVFVVRKVLHRGIMPFLKLRIAQQVGVHLLESEFD